MHDMPPVGLPHPLAQLLRLGAHLLQTDRVGGGVGEPLHEALLGGGPQPVHIYRGHSEHLGTIPAHWDAQTTAERMDIR
ncbi:hypothetical protein SGFS_051800 [Streptomyces graminofaciens]|uniref:Uncharacterized protein n=1 Tax=Streptomyces graminofaciens TaxID=68212 RepID=A0ABM7FBR4_9ACTN|nr:hypothetical protein SGFS_051800 [Streptomyces graminofaciens]